MAKYVKQVTGDFDAILEHLHQAVLGGSMSASYEDGSDYSQGDFRCAVRVYERYSWTGGNRVSMSSPWRGPMAATFSPPSPPGAARPPSSS